MNKYYLALTTFDKPIELKFKNNEYTLDQLHSMYSDIYKSEYIGIFTTAAECEVFIEIYKEDLPIDDTLCNDFDKIIHLENCLALKLDTNI